jgi:hypothetical protein
MNRIRQLSTREQAIRYTGAGSSKNYPKHVAEKKTQENTGDWSIWENHGMEVQL